MSQRAGVVGVGLLALVGSLGGCAPKAQPQAPNAASAAAKSTLEIDPSPASVHPPPGAIVDPTTVCKLATDNPTARALYAKACNANDGEGCAKLAAIYACGTGVEREPATALSLADRACATRGFDKGCYIQGVLLIDGTMVPRDVARGIAILDRDCARGRMDSCEASGVLRAMTDAAPVQRYGFTLLEKACEGGTMDACANLAVFESQGLAGRPTHPARAHALARRACEGGSLQGCTLLATMLLLGQGVAQNEARAAKIFRTACEAGSADACLGWAKCQYLGVGVTRDAGEALTTLRRACDKNNGQACRLLADMGDASNVTAATPVGPGVF